MPQGRIEGLAATKHLIDDNPKPASIMTINFAHVPQIFQHPSGKLRDPANAHDPRPMDGEGRLLTPKQIRARARRKLHQKNPKPMTDLEFNRLYKPVEEWDLEELAHGRPRDKNGAFAGRKPSWINREVHERAMEMFQLAVKQRMGVQGLNALDTLQYILSNEDTDHRGKPLIPASTKLQASTFLLEHIVGKPTQKVEADISVKLQAIMASVMVNPTETVDQQGNSIATISPYSTTKDGSMLGESAPVYEIAHFPGHTIPIGVPEKTTDEDFDPDEFGEG